MQYYNKQHNYYCGIDLHARTMYLCILDSKGDVKLYKNIKNSPYALKKAIVNWLRAGLLIPVPKRMLIWILS